MFLFRKSLCIQDYRKLLQDLYQLVQILPFDQNVAQKSANVGKRLQARGEKIGLGDTLIAGTCLSQQVPLLTRNVRHFSRVPNLHVITPDELVLDDN